MKYDEVIDVPIKQDSIRIDPDTISALLGYDKNGTDSFIEDVINNCIKEAYNKLKPKASILFVNINRLDTKNGEIEIGGTTFNVKRIIASQLKLAEYTAIFISTIGSEIEGLSKTHTQQGDLLEGLIFDLIGSEMAEAVAGLAHNKVKSLSKDEKMNISNRFSPGYCDWNVNEQFKLFSLYGNYHSGVKLNSSALMSPMKSVSGIVGIGKHIKYKPYTCSACKDENCIYRNKKTSIVHKN